MKQRQRGLPVRSAMDSTKKGALTPKPTLMHFLLMLGSLLLFGFQVSTWHQLLLLPAHTSIPVATAPAHTAAVNSHVPAHSLTAQSTCPICSQAAYLTHGPFHTSTAPSIASIRSAASDVAGQQQQQLSMCAHALLAACPGLPGYCPRPPDMSRQTHTAYLEPQGPSHPQLAKQKAAVDAFIAGRGFQERLSKLRQLPDQQGILLSGGKKHVGSMALTLHVSVRKLCLCCGEVRYGCLLRLQRKTRSRAVLQAQPGY